MNRFDWKKLSLPIVCMAVFGLTSPFAHTTAHAVPLYRFTGHEVPLSVPSTISATVNYAVLPPFDPFGSVLAQAYVPAQGNPGFDASKYTYLYQVANPASSRVTWTSFQPQFSVATPVSTTSTGSFASGSFRLDFLNGGSIVNASGNNLQGAHSFGIGARTVSGPERIEILSNPFGGHSHPYSTFLNQGLTPGFTSPLFGFQSSNGPTFTTGLLQGDVFGPGGTFAAPISMFVTVPSAGAPEPGTILLIGSGALGLFVWRWKQIKQELSVRARE